MLIKWGKAHFGLKFWNSSGSRKEKVSCVVSFPHDPASVFSGHFRRHVDEPAEISVLYGNMGENGPSDLARSVALEAPLSIILS